MEMLRRPQRQQELDGRASIRKSISWEWTARLLKKNRQKLVGSMI